MQFGDLILFQALIASWRKASRFSSRSTYCMIASRMSQCAVELYPQWLFYAM
jgi:hypothetical protein